MQVSTVSAAMAAGPMAMAAGPMAMAAGPMAMAAGPMPMAAPQAQPGLPMAAAQAQLGLPMAAAQAQLGLPMAAAQAQLGLPMAAAQAQQGLPMAAAQAQLGRPMAAPVVNQPQGQPQPQVVLNIQTGPQAPVLPILPQMGGPTAFGPIAWSTGLFQCFEDIPMCILGCLCPFILPCYLSALFGETCFFGVLPGSMFALRTGIRERYKIPGDLLNDYCSVCCCLACAQCQMAREIKGREWRHAKFPMPRAHFHFNFDRRPRW